MDSHLDHKIRLNNEPQGPSLYGWSLEEIDKHGDRIGSDYVPWSWPTYFTLAELQISRSISGKVEGLALGKVSESSVLDIEETEQIRGTLRRQDKVSYSMLGTRRTIDKFAIYIDRSSDEDEPESCTLSGVVSYTAEGEDFRKETQDDAVDVCLVLSEQKFDRIAKLVRAHQVESAVLRLGGVAGFYSRWEPTSFTSDIKVLAAHTDQEILVPDGSEIIPPRLGDVGDFCLTFSSRCDLLADST